MISDMSSEKPAYIMSTEESLRIIDLLSDAIMEERSKDEVYEIFREAGIITKDGNLRSPYKDLKIPVE